MFDAVLTHLCLLQQSVHTSFIHHAAATDMPNCHPNLREILETSRSPTQTSNLHFLKLENSCSILTVPINYTHKVVWSGCKKSDTSFMETLTLCTQDLPRTHLAHYRLGSVVFIIIITTITIVMIIVINAIKLFIINNNNNKFDYYC